MELVMVEFACGADQVHDCVKALTNLMNSLVAQQPHFYGATIHIEADTGKVINTMRWRSHQGFLSFRDANQESIGPAIGRFSLTPRWLTIAAEIKSQR